MPTGAPLNIDTTTSAQSPDTASVDGVSYLASLKTDGTHPQLRVKRLIGDAWVPRAPGQ